MNITFIFGESETDIVSTLPAIIARTLVNSIL